MVRLCPITQIGAVSLGIKPAELVKCSLPCLECFKEYNLLTYALARDFYLVYQPVLLQISLESPCIGEILQRLGYSLNVKQALSLLSERFLGGCPPEIGFFIGYPPKDVFGFMGYGGFSYVKTQGWRMYKPLSPSEKLYWQYKRAREVINQYHPSLCTTN